MAEAVAQVQCPSTRCHSPANPVITLIKATPRQKERVLVRQLGNTRLQLAPNNTGLQPSLASHESVKADSGVIHSVIVNDLQRNPTLDAAECDKFFQNPLSLRLTILPFTLSATFPPQSSVAHATLTHFPLPLIPFVPLSVTYHENEGISTLRDPGVTPEFISVL